MLIEVNRWRPLERKRSSRLIETDLFPIEFISALAERESWRKDIYRPIYHLHKWWAKRLGTIFRGILIGCMLPEDADLKKSFYQRHDFKGTVFDPFMGSGTTIGEAHKLGFAALGRDINPVACESVRVALGPLDRRRLKEAFHHLANTVGQRILGLYQSADASGRPCDVLYFFWVKNIPCPHCHKGVDLFSDWIVARNAYPDRKTEIQVCCPRCGGIFSADNSRHSLRCSRCNFDFNPHKGIVQGMKAACPYCAETFRTIDAVRSLKRPPSHRLYGKLILTPEGEKKYLAATSDDIAAHQQCGRELAREVKHGRIRLPEISLTEGFNTRQAMGYNYLRWKDFFNDRQLLALGWLQEAIAALSDPETRDAMLTLFSGVLEFNNLFASYKGEGTGAVRHMFAHHILKPERTPIEANVWGTPKSSGSFSNLFKSRMMRALDYRDLPFEVALEGPNNKISSPVPFSGKVSAWPQRKRKTDYGPRGLYLSCGSSDDTHLPDQSVDLVVTDPPFFDNVHYSELADFFFAWQVLYPRGYINGSVTTRHPREVQDADAQSFAAKLGAVFAECYRVLRDEGLLVFTYHHSRPEGWKSLAAAIIESGFSVVNSHPVKAEMSVAAPKSQAKEPIQIDIILVCKKRTRDGRPPRSPEEALEVAMAQALNKTGRLLSNGLKLSLNDRKVIVMGQFLAALGPVVEAQTVAAALDEAQAGLEAAALKLAEAKPKADETDKPMKPKQILLPY